MKNPILSRLAAFFLAVCLLASYAVPVRAAGVHWQEVDINAPAPDLTDRRVEEIPPETGYQATDIVRVSIVLAEKSTVQAGYATMGIARNQSHGLPGQLADSTGDDGADHLRPGAGRQSIGRGVELDPGRKHHLRQRTLWKAGRNSAAARRGGRLRGAMVRTSDHGRSGRCVTPNLHLLRYDWGRPGLGAGATPARAAGLPSLTPVRTRTTSPLTTVHSCTP